MICPPSSMIKLLLKSNREELHRSIRVALGQTVTFGSSPMADFQIRAGNLKDNHFRLALRRGGCFLECFDLNSDVTVNDRPRNRLRLNHGDRLQLGDLIFEAWIEGAPQSPAEPEATDDADEQDTLPSSDLAKDAQSDLAWMVRSDEDTASMEHVGLDDFLVDPDLDPALSANEPATESQPPAQSTPVEELEPSSELDHVDNSNDESDAPVESEHLQAEQLPELTPANDPGEHGKEIAPSNAAPADEETAAPDTTHDGPSDPQSAEHAHANAPCASTDSSEPEKSPAAEKPADPSENSQVENIEARRANNGLLWRYSLPNSALTLLLEQQDQVVELKYQNGIVAAEFLDSQNLDLSHKAIITWTDRQPAELQTAFQPYAARFRHQMVLSNYLNFLPAAKCTRFFDIVDAILLVDAEEAVIFSTSSPEQISERTGLNIIEE